MKSDNTLTAYRMELVAAALAGGPLCVHDLAPNIFLCYGQAWRLIKDMHEQGMVHIAKWPLRRTPRATRVAAYAFGAGKDAPKPKRLTSAQRQARYKSKLRADPERLDIHLSKGRARKRKPTRDPLIAAMYGAPTVRATEGASHA
jgi:hypothetical protein